MKVRDFLTEARAVKLDGQPYPSRHRPRHLICQFEDDKMRRCLVKIVRTANTAAANVSELVSHLVLCPSPFAKLTPVLVRMSDALFADATEGEEVTCRNVGTHFGTVWRDDVDQGPIRSFDEPVAMWSHILYLLGVDIWLKNGDRATTGNVLLATLGDKLRLIAADQSDCFGGVDTLRAGSDAVRAAAVPPELAIKGVTPARVADRAKGDVQNLIDWIVKDCSKMADLGSAALGYCSSGWAEVGGFDPCFIPGFLTESAAQLESKLRSHLEIVPDDAVSGGILLDIPETDK